MHSASNIREIEIERVRARTKKKETPHGQGFIHVRLKRQGGDMLSFPRALPPIFSRA